MEISYERGIIIRDSGKKIFLDPEISKIGHAVNSIITHAHSDHTQGMSSANVTYTTQPTLDLFSASQRKKNPKNIRTVDFHQPFELEGFEIELLPAGHLLGAAQVLVRKGNTTVHFSGDFCPEPLLAVEAAVLPKDVDVSILDATYGDERIVFNDRLNERQRIFVWTLGVVNSKKIPVLHVAHLGGAQEIIKLFNQLAPNLKVYVHENIQFVNQVYQDNNVDLSYESLTNITKKQLLSEKSVVLLPRAASNSKAFLNDFELDADEIAKGIITGQTAKYGFNSFDFSSNLSSHASYHELIDVVEKIKPMQVLTHYGYSERLAYTLNVRYDIPSMEVSQCEALDITRISKRRESYKQLNSKSYDLKKHNEEIWNDFFD